MKMDQYIDDEMESRCLALRGKGQVMYIYPFVLDIALNGAKVITRDGRKVRNIRVIKEQDGSDTVYASLDGITLKWDAHGRYSGPYLNHANDLYIPERYFDPDWKQRIQLSNAEWAVNFQRQHHDVPSSWTTREYKIPSPHNTNTP